MLSPTCVPSFFIGQRPKKLMFMHPRVSASPSVFGAFSLYWQRPEDRTNLRCLAGEFLRVVSHGGTKAAAQYFDAACEEADGSYGILRWHHLVSLFYPTSDTGVSAFPETATTSIRCTRPQQKTSHRVKDPDISLSRILPCWVLVPHLAM